VKGSEIFVYVDIENAPIVVGRLWTHVRSGNDIATFEYFTSWIRNPYHFSLEPALTIGPGPHHVAVGRSLFAASGNLVPTVGDGL
jgi:serine/threonine-protein kinase HipA